MILLLGGTSETAFFAQALAEKGYHVCVSTTTKVPLDIGRHPFIERSQERLDESAMKTLIIKKGITAILDATHPYAAEIKKLARCIAKELDLPYFQYLRPGALSDQDNACFAPDHDSAALLACSYQKPILLTIGAKFVAAYAVQANKIAVPLVARVLDSTESIQACLSAGIESNRIIAGRGPFSTEDNIHHIRQFSIGVVVTKDGGNEGGFREKIKAAQSENCTVIVVERPLSENPHFFNSKESLIRMLTSQLHPKASLAPGTF